MTYYLDTNIIVYAVNDENSPVWKKLREIPSMSIVVPEIVLGELEYGARKSMNYKKNKEINEMFLSSFELVPFCGRKMAEEYGKIRSDLEKIGKPIGSNDLLIAATVLAEGGTLVTHNTKEFSRVEGLKIEDWCIE